MMLVRQQPDTLGYRRLMAKSQESGDLKYFFEEKGLPDFVAEATSSDREYLIFYYLERRQAFACRRKISGVGNLEFAGPYPMTAGESKMLTEVKKNAEKASRTR